MKTSKVNTTRVLSGFQMFLALTTTLWFVLVLHCFKSMPGIKRFYNKRPLSSVPLNLHYQMTWICSYVLHTRLIIWSYVCQISWFQWYIAYNHWLVAYLVVKRICGSYWHIWAALFLTALFTNVCCKTKMLGKSDSNKFCVAVLILLSIFNLN